MGKCEEVEKVFIVCKLTRPIKPTRPWGVFEVEVGGRGMSLLGFCWENSLFSANLIFLEKKNCWGCLKPDYGGK
jgi:hypothetical protein